LDTAYQVLEFILLAITFIYQTVLNLIYYIPDKYLWIVAGVLTGTIVLNIILTKIGRFIPSKPHRRNISAGNKSISKIQRMAGSGDYAGVFHFIRYSITPYVFEEMILTAFKRSGARIKRSPSYSGDGGIDGEVRIKGVRYLIQTKKYAEYIKAADVQKHIRICTRKRTKGFFVHSGETGGMSKNHAKESCVEIISGRELVDLLCGNRLF
jgi:restriction system protein